MKNVKIISFFIAAIVALFGTPAMAAPAGLPEAATGKMPEKAAEQVPVMSERENLQKHLPLGMETSMCRRVLYQPRQ